MHVTYTFEPHPRGTHARIRVQGGNDGGVRLRLPSL